MDLVDVESILPADRAALDRFEAGDAWLAGGTSLFSEPAPGLRRLFDLRAFAWPTLTLSADGLEIAATCPIATLEGFTAPTHWRAATLFSLCPRALYGSWKIWGEATVGGNLCLALPAGAMIAMAVALDATGTVWMPGGGARELRVVDLILGPGRISLTSGELLRSISVGPAALLSEVALRQASLSPRGRSAALVIGRRAPDGVTTVTLTAAVSHPTVLRFSAPPAAEELAAAFADTDIEYFDDVHGDPDWRAHLCRHLAAEVVEELAVAA